MDKQQLLEEVSKMAAAGQITQQELNSVFLQSHAPQPQSDPSASHLKLSEVMYYIGGAIVFLGICVLSYQNWDSFSSALRILITLGSFIAAFIVAALLYKYPDLVKLSQAFFLLAGILAPLGMYVLFKEIGMDTTSDFIQLVIFLILSAFFLIALKFFQRQTILLFFSIVFLTAAFYLVISLLVGNNFTGSDYDKINSYRTLVAALAWMFLGYFFANTSYKAITGALYGFGVLSFLTAALILGGYQPSQNIFWELIYPILVFGVIFASVYIKSKSFLVFGSIFLIVYILKITAEYFTSGLGWPLALVIAGFAIMAVGWYSVRINKKYFVKTI